MTTGSIPRILLRFTLPLILSGMLQQLYGWVDALIVGNAIGEEALAAIGTTGSISQLFITLIIGFTTGVGILIAQYQGAGDSSAIRRTMHAFFLFLMPVCMVLTLLGVLVAHPILVLTETPDNVLAQSRTYLRIIFLGIPFLTIYNLYGSAVRALGDSRTPLLAMVISTVVNFALDCLFIIVFHMGVAGAALATIAAQAMAGLFLFLYGHGKYLPLRLTRAPFDRAIFRQGMRLALPTTLQSGVMAIGGLALQNVMNSFGSQTVAAVTTVYRIDSLLLLPIHNGAAGVSTFVGQNYGAGQAERARRGMYVGMAFCAGFALAILILLLTGGRALMGLFGVSRQAAQMGQTLLIAFSLFYPLFGIYNCICAYLQGIGDTRYAAIINITGLGVRIALSYLLRASVGYTIIAYAEIAAWIGAGVFLIAGCYRHLNRCGAISRISPFTNG